MARSASVGLRVQLGDVRLARYEPAPEALLAYFLSWLKWRELPRIG
jgi:hypothetical protein